MTSIKREAIRDADEYAMAKMFYGEGAGIRRRLINQTVQFKIANIPGYSEAFQQELAKQDFAKLSRKARKHRRVIDTKDTINKNGKALVRGDYRGMSLPIVVVAGVGYFAHQTGYDKKALEFSQREYAKAKARVKNWNDERKARKNSSDNPQVTTIRPQGPVVR